MRFRPASHDTSQHTALMYGPGSCGSQARRRAARALVGIVALLALTVPIAVFRAPSTAAHADGASVTADDNAIGTGLNQWQYAGSNWQSCVSCGGGGDPTVHWTNTASANATLRFSGTGVTFYSNLAPNHGIAAISIDGGPSQDVDTYGSRSQGYQPLFTASGLTDTTHTLVVTITGRRSASATDSSWILTRL